MIVRFQHRALTALLCALFFLKAPYACATEIDFASVLRAAQKDAFDLKIARENRKASQAHIAEAQAAYYPQLSLRLGNEYVHSFSANGDVVSVGDAIIANDASGYKHSLIAGLNYNLFDFGIRRLTVENAARQVVIAHLREKQTLRDLRKELLSRYASALKIQKQQRTQAAILKRRNLIFRLSRQLRQAGTLGREQLNSAALQLAESLAQLDDLKLRLRKALNRLFFYRGQPRTEEHTQLVDLVPIADPSAAVVLESAPEVQILQQQINDKKAELSMVKRAQLPKLTLDGSYRMFGNDSNSFTHSWSNLSSRDASLTVYLEWSLFAGFKNPATRARLNHEIASLRYQKQKKRAELEQEFAGLSSSYAAYSAGQQNLLHQQLQILQQQTDARQLAEQQVTDQIAFHEKMIRLARQQLKTELWQIDYATSTIALDFIQEPTL